ncbi:MAG: acetylornithine deacetylase/succinyl-diaminopimelate desuccinylase family protein [Devosia sp.]|nr:acetylornithine deacetylase/succinyl-diaminopimelate desuccinylase family protein [Devosia sp.]
MTASPPFQSSAGRRETLLAAIESRRDDLVALTRDLIGIPTINPPGNAYLEICEYLGKRLKSRGFTIEMIRAEGAPGDSDKYPRWNVIARREGAHPGECVHFNSHIDVVETGSGWTVDPFGGELKDGKVYGRGACDMKGGLAASIIAAEAFADTFPEFAGAIEISGTADEETGGYGGVAWLAEKGWFSPSRVQHVIIPEPLNKDRVCLGHRGVWWAEIETRGRIAHGSMPFLGDSAIRHMGAVLAEMEETLYPALAGRHTEMPVVPPQARQSSMNINSIHGGLPEPEPDFTGFPSAVVAHSARMVIDRRYLIEESGEGVRQEIVDVLERVKARRATFSYELRELWTVSPTMTEKDAPVVTAVSAAITEVLGLSPEYVVSPGTYDQKHIDRIGRMHNCIAYGPGILDLAHQPDEYVGVDDMIDSAKVMALALMRLLGAGSEI